MRRLLGCCCTQTSEFMVENTRSGKRTDTRFYTFPNYIENTTFGISCDATANMKVG
jgi:hypothetical protein